MNLLFCYQELISRTLERKKTLIALVAVFLISVVLGILFISTPAIYSYHINLCDRFVDRVCYSDESVIVIFLERFAGNAVYLLLFSAAGIHVAGGILPPVILIYRAYTFGGSLAIFFSVYQLSGVLIVFALYLPIHLLIDAVLLCAATLSYERARCYCFSREDFLSLLRDFLLLLAVIAAICLLEMILLFALFHPIGNLM